MTFSEGGHKRLPKCGVLNRLVLNESLFNFHESLLRASIIAVNDSSHEGASLFSGYATVLRIQALS